MKKIIYTMGYTLFQNGFDIEIERMFQTLKGYGINFLVDVRSVPFSKQYPQCNADNMKIAGKELGIPYIVSKRYFLRQRTYSSSKRFSP